MSSESGDTPGGPRGSTGPSSSGSQGASRGGFRPEDLDSGAERRPDDTDPTESRSTSDRQRRGSAGATGAPFGGFPFGGRGSNGRESPKFLGLPVTLIYAMGAAILGIIFIGAMCGSPSTRTGTVAGQVKALNADRSVSTLAGAQLTLHGSGGPYTTTSTDVDPNAEGEAAFNYRFENVPAGTYSMSVAPPAGAAFQPEDSLAVEVKSGQLFPQSVMLLADGVQKPRQLAQNELQPGEAGGYVNDRGERVTYQQGSGFDASDAMLMYLLWRNPPGWGYGAPPIIYGGGGSSTGSNYRVADPPSRTSSGQTVTQRPPSVPGQGSTRPSSGTGATGAGPSYTSGSRDSDAAAPAQTKPSTSSSGSNTGTSTQTKPSTSTGAGSSTTTRPSAPSQGASRPSSSSSSSSRPSSSGSRSSGGGRR
jgi:hypothetical protein